MGILAPQSSPIIIKTVIFNLLFISSWLNAHGEHNSMGRPGEPLSEYSPCRRRTSTTPYSHGGASPPLNNSTANVSSVGTAQCMVMGWGGLQAEVGRGKWTECACSPYIMKHLFGKANSPVSQTSFKLPSCSAATGVALAEFALAELLNSHWLHSCTLCGGVVTLPFQGGELL